MHIKRYWHNYALRLFSIALVLVVALLAVLPAAAGSEDKTDEVNVVLLLDNTGSMNGNDRSKISVASAKNFIEYLAETRRASQNFGTSVPAVNVGVFTFSDTANEICPMTDISDANKVADMVRRIEAIEYRQSGTGATYYGPALNAALNTLPASNETIKSMVFLFTDGKPDGKNADSDANRPDNAIQSLSRNGVEVMVLGLDVKQSIDDEAKQMIYKIANDTQREEGISPRAEGDQSANGLSKANYHIANALNQDLTNFLMGIISDKIGLDVDRYEGEIVVDKREVVLVNVFVVDEKADSVGTIGLCLGDEPITLEETSSYYDDSAPFEDNTFTILNSGRSAFITMYAPALGTYVIDLPTTADYIVHYKTIEIGGSYTIDLDAEIDREVPNVCKCSISVTTDGEQSVGGLEEIITVKAIGEDEMHTDTVKVDSIRFNRDTGKYETELIAALPGEYTIVASVDEGYLTGDKRVSAEKTVEFTAKRSPTSEIKVNIIINKDKDIDFAREYYPEWPGVKSTNKIENMNPELIELNQNEDGSYTAHGLKLGTGTIIDTITDDLGNKYIITYNFCVIRDPLPIIIIICAAAAAIAALGAVAHIKFKRHLPGEFSIEYDGDLYSEIIPPNGIVFKAYDICKKCEDLPRDLPAELVNKLKKVQISVMTRSVEDIDEDGEPIKFKVKTYYIKKDRHDLKDDEYRVEYYRDGSTEEFTFVYTDD